MAPLLSTLVVPSGGRWRFRGNIWRPTVTWPAHHAPAYLIGSDEAARLADSFRFDACLKRERLLDILRSAATA
jgi:hypothetical protein